MKPVHAVTDEQEPSPESRRGKLALFLRRAYKRKPEFPEDIEHETSDFSNWAKTVSSKKVVKFYPKSSADIQRIVRYAKSVGKTVRCVGFGHTWDPQFADDNQILISNLPFGYIEPHTLKEVLTGPHPELCKGSELSKLEFLRTDNGEIQTIPAQNRVTGEPERRALIQVGPHVTNEHLRKFCVESGNWTIATNVIMRDVTLAGSVMNMCHGAGITTRTVSDLVKEIVFINAKGKKQVVNDPEQLRAVAGSFGLFGPIVSMTLALDPMTHARMKPHWQTAVEAIPPLKKAGLSKKHQEAWDKAFGPDGTESDRYKTAVQFFNDNALKRYCEWFLFARGNRVWVNCWEDDGNKEEAETYPGHWKVKSEHVQGVLGRAAVKYAAPFLKPRQFAKARTFLTEHTSTLPSDKEIVTDMSNAIHFRTGIHAMEVRCMEVLMKLPELEDGRFDFDIMRKAWWDAIELSRSKKYKEDCPLNLVIEARILGGSDVLLAPEAGNKGTLSIEVLSTEPFNEKDRQRFKKAWDEYTNDLYKLWSSYKDKDGNPIPVLPHFAKEWRHLSVQPDPESDDKISLVDHLRENQLKDRIAEFRRVAEEVCDEGGYSLAEMRQQYCNEGLNALLFGEEPAAEVAEEQEQVVAAPERPKQRVRIVV